ncbi:sodium-dependent nutrient amino acid transporter 1-like [Parasteatoda tepidariorum]|uniref:sodium-dependent nutrient amino acid transporter 1-like n=1 Tax=Parasteatoda tepidariorum TaxID=114398 RepID=UPI001C7294BB|nr:sodium-dependent nutrient amino acid transporter 1-like [Parasteatoda tepidariorum]
MAFTLGFSSSSYNLEKKRNSRDSFAVPRISVTQVVNGVKIPPEEEEVSERGTWSKSIQSLFLCLSMSVGLGNIWRFPNVAYNNGGGAFLIPYLLLLFIIGRPLYYLELILGQFSSQGPIKVWRIVPALKGIGYAQIISASYVAIFYNYLMALSVFYIFSSMQSCLPWTACNILNESMSLNVSLSDDMAMSEYFWRTEVLQKQVDTDYLTINWKLVLCLLLTWTIVYTSVIQGTNSLGKMSYFTAIFPFFGLICLLIIACLEEGAGEGIKFFFKPDIEKLKDVNVWYKATEQSFFSLNIAYGSIVMIASYNKFHHNIYRDAIIISVLDTIVNLLAGCVSFAVLGSLSYKYSKNITEVVDHEGLGLAFIVYPEALANISYVPQLWSVLFFFMLFVLGVGSSMSMIETLLTVLKDRFPSLRQRKWLIALVICMLFCALGIPLTTSSGQTILVLLNNYGVGVAIFFYAVFEVVGVTWIYGLNSFCKDVTYMLNKPPGIFWKITWAVTAPVALTVIFLFGVIHTETDNNPSVPQWATILGWILAAFALVQIPLWFIITLYKDSSVGIVQKFINILRPSENWGPSSPIHFAGWKSYKNPDQQSKQPVNLASTVPAAYENQTFAEDVF